jgi:hypothetical protein
VCNVVCLCEKDEQQFHLCIVCVCAAQSTKKRSFFVASAARVFSDVVVWIARLTDAVIYEVCTSQFWDAVDFESSWTEANDVVFYFFRSQSLSSFFVL